jgi:hypothetical protein
MSATKIYSYNLIMALTYRERKLLKNDMQNFILNFFINLPSKNDYLIFNHFLKEGYKRPTIYTLSKDCPSLSLSSIEK